MHLSNEQLLEPSDHDLVHVSQCPECRSRIQNLGLIRSSLQSLPEETPSADQWREIKRDFETQIGLMQMVSARRATVFWKITSSALAVCFTFFLIWQNYFVTPDKHGLSQNAGIAVLINENGAMQQRLDSQLIVQTALNVRTAALLIELDIINTKLEQAYLKKRSTEQKLSLWQERQALLASTLAAINQPHVIKL